MTGAIARTAANIRSGARTPIAGIVHALVLLLFVLVAAKLAALIPLAALSAVLIGVALRMGEWDTFAEMWRASRTDFGVLLTAFALTVVFDLTIGVGGGLVIAAVLFLRRMESVTQVRVLTAENDTEQGGVNVLVAGLRGLDLVVDPVVPERQGVVVSHGPKCCTGSHPHGGARLKSISGHPVRECADTRDRDGNFVPGSQGEIVRRHDAGPGEQKSAGAKGQFAKQVSRELGLRAAHLRR